MPKPYKLRRRLAVFSRFFPPVLNGNALSIRNFLRYLDQDRIIAFTRTKHLFHRIDPSTALGCKVIDVSPPIPALLEKAFVRFGVNDLAQLAIGGHMYAKGVYHCRKFGAEAVLAIHGHHYFVIARAVARTIGAKFYVQMFDPVLPEDLPLEPARRIFAPLLKQTFRDADGVLVFNDCLAELVRERYGVEAHVVPQCVPNLERIATYQARRLSSPVRLVFTGVVNLAHIDALKFLLETLDQNDYDAEVVIYTPRPSSFFERHGIKSPRLKLDLVPNTEIEQVQRSADILLLFGSFDYPSDWRNVIRTMYPTKIVEYYASARPILLIAPPNACVTRYARRFASMAIVDTKDPQMLLDTLNRLRRSSKYRRQIVNNALEALHELHHPDKVLPRFLQVINA